LKPDDILARLTYAQLTAELNELSDEIDRYRDMTPEEEREFRQAREPLPDDFRDVFIVRAGLRQVEVARECLRRVDVGTLARDTGYPTTSLILLSCYRGDPPDPDSN